MQVPFQKPPRVFPEWCSQSRIYFTTNRSASCRRREKSSSEHSVMTVKGSRKFRQNISIKLLPLTRCFSFPTMIGKDRLVAMDTKSSTSLTELTWISNCRISTSGLYKRCVFVYNEEQRPMLSAARGYLSTIIPRPLEIAIVRLDDLNKLWNL